MKRINMITALACINSFMFNPSIHAAAEQEISPEQQPLNAQLFEAVKWNFNVKKVRSLIQQRADVNARNSDDRTPLMIAAARDKSAIVQELLEHKADAHSATAKGFDALMLAAYFNANKSVKLLLAQKIDPLAEHVPDGVNAFSMAIVRGNDEVVKTLIEHNVDPNTRLAQGTPPLRIAAELEKASTVQTLLDSKADPNGIADDGVTALMHAAQKNSIKSAATLLKGKADVNAVRETTGKRALDFALDQENLKVASLLLKHKADTSTPNLKRQEHNQLALRRAIAGNNTPVIKTLLDGQADVNAATADGITSLMVAAANGNDPIVKALLKKKANINAQCARRDTALTYAFKECKPSTVQLLIEQKADQDTNLVDENEKHSLMTLAGLPHVDTETIQVLIKQHISVDESDTDGHTPLMYAAHQNDSTKIEFLLEKKALIDRENKTGDTSLIIAAAKGNMEAVQTLLAKKANVNHASHNRSTPLSYAARSGHLDVAQHLVDAKATIDSVDADGATPLTAAAEKNHVGVVRFLAFAGADIKRVSADMECLESTRQVMVDAYNARQELKVKNDLLEFFLTKPLIQIINDYAVPRDPLLQRLIDRRTKKNKMPLLPALALTQAAANTAAPGRSFLQQLTASFGTFANRFQHWRPLVLADNSAMPLLLDPVELPHHYDNDDEKDNVALAEAYAAATENDHEYRGTAIVRSRPRSAASRSLD